MRTVNRLPTSRLQRFLRTTALILALIFLGISGGMTLNHTEDLGSLMRFHAGASKFSQGSAGSGPDVCLACQWENSLFSPQVPAVSVTHLPLTRIALQPMAAQTRFPQSFDHTSPRAPPHVS